MAQVALELREDIIDRWQTPQSARSTRYFDRRFQTEAMKLMPGEFAGTGGDLMLVTILGSCVAACLFDPEARVGGMNHFMLPGDDASKSGSGTGSPHESRQLRRGQSPAHGRALGRLRRSSTFPRSGNKQEKRQITMQLNCNGADMKSANHKLI